MGKRLLFSILLVFLVGAFAVQHKSPVHEVLAIRLDAPLTNSIERLMAALLDTGHRVTGFDFEGNLLTFYHPEKPYSGRIMVFEDENSKMVIRFHTYWTSRIFPFSQSFSEVDYQILESLGSQNKIKYDIALDEVVRDRDHHH